MLYKKITNTHAETKLYGNIGGWFANGDTFTSFLDGLEAAGFKELTIRWHCYGGSVFEGNVIGNAFGRSALKINIIIDGLAASMGCFILPYVPVENVQIAENAFGMVHRPSSGEMGDADAHLNTAKLLQDMENNFIKVVSERSGKTQDEVKALWFDGKDHWLNADEMVSYGFVGKKVSAVAKNIKELDKQTIENMQVESIYDQYAASLDKNSSINKNKKIMNVALLIAAFALTGVTAESTETEVLAALQQKFQALNDKVANLEATAKAKTTAAITALIEKHKSKFTLQPGQKLEDVVATYKGIGETSGVEALSMVLDGMQPKADLATFISTGGGSNSGQQAGDPKNFDELVSLGNEAIAKFKEERKDDYNRLYKAEFGHSPTC
jgi:ATP-dependent Clp protease, protease subunit